MVKAVLGFKRQVFSTLPFFPAGRSGERKGGEGGLHTQHKFVTKIIQTYPTFMEGG